MGCQQSDPAITLSISLNSQSAYFPGDTVAGTVYLDLSQPRNIPFLTLSFICNEKSSWVKVYGHTVIVYGNKLETYHSENVLKTFAYDGVEPGRYSYGFKFVVPDNLPATLILNTSNFISYAINASIRQSGERQYINLASIPLIIEQTQRNPLNLMNETQSQVKCWSCCCLQNTVKYKMEISSNQIQGGDLIRCSLYVNNIQGRDQIKRVVFVLKEYIKQVSDWDYQNQYVNNSYQLTDWQGLIYPGGEQFIQAELQIPVEVAFWSSIGQTIERFYLIEAYCDFGCCSNNAVVSIPVIVNSIQGVVVVDRGNSTVGDYLYEEGSVIQLPSYIYSPKKGIVNQNQDGRTIEISKHYEALDLQFSSQKGRNSEIQRQKRVQIMDSMRYRLEKDALLDND